MNKSFTEQKIEINRLNLWDENARFPDKYFNSIQEELIKYFISKKEFKIEKLIQEIVKDFDLPQAEKLIVWDNDGELVVLEGNRRLTSYKLLSNPDLISQPKRLRKFIEENSLKISITANYKLDCLVTKNKEEGLRFIDRKHANGNNEVNWQDTERAHYNVRRGRSNESELIKIEISKLVREIDLPDQIKERVLGRNYVTTFFRIVTTGPAKKKFGLKIDDKGNLLYKENFIQELKIIIHNVIKKQTFAGKKIDSRSLNRNTEIKAYLDEIDKSDVKKVEKEIQENTTIDIFGEETIRIKQPTKNIVFPKSTSRNYLIPSSCRLSIHESKINNIYHELQNDLLLDESNKSVPNAVAVLFRVFLEISIDYFLEINGYTPSPKTKIKQKIKRCIDKMLELDIANDTQLKNIRKVMSDGDSGLGFLSIENFHDYIHSYRSNPTSDILKGRWDNLQEFMQLLWDHCYKIEILSKKDV